MKFYSDNGDIVSAVFILMVFYRLIADQPLDMLGEDEGKLCRQIISETGNDSSQ